MGGLRKGISHFRGVGIQSSGVHYPTARSTTRGRQRDANPLALSGEGHGGVDKRIQLLGIRSARAERGQVAATQGRALASAEDKLSDDAICPAFAQAPGAGDALSHVARLLSSRSSQAAQRISDLPAQDRAKGLIALGHACDSLLEFRQRSIGRAIDSAQAELHTQIQQELVAAGGHPLDEQFDGIGRTHLIQADLGPHRHEHFGGELRAQRLIRWGLPTRSRCRNRSHEGRGLRCCRGLRDQACCGSARFGTILSARFSRCIRRRSLLRLRASDGILSEDDAAVALDVEHLDAVACILRQAQGLAQHVRQRWRGTHAHLDKALHAQARGAGAADGARLAKQEILGFDPSDR